jgi:hypothetical protein
MKGARAGAGLHYSATLSVAGCVREPISSVGWKACCGRDVRGQRQVFLNVVLGAFSTGVFNTNALPRINIGADVWGESSIMTGVYQHWCSSTLQIGRGLCDRVCQVLVCRGRYCLGGGGSSLHSGIEFGRSRTGEGSSGGRKKGVM